MFDTKNLSPKQLSFFTALLFSLPVSAGVLLLNGSWKEGLGAFLLTLGGSYLILVSVIQNFIYRKIKLIYKFIHQTKASKKEEMYYKYILPRKSIDQVREDVEAWAGQRSREIEILKHNETFRKEFLQNLSHEVKTPVFAIQGYIDTLLQGAMENPQMNRRFLEKAARNVERLTNLIRDLDEISRLEAGELQLHRQYFVIQDLIREVFDSLGWMSEEKGITFGIKKGCEKPVAVWADKEKIRQVLNNLVQNGIKYGRDEGAIVASIYNTDDNNVLVEISDDGIGIPEKHLGRIFERFYRTNEGRSRDTRGSGLGLSICKHIIEAHGHNIHVRSKESVGTTIGFTLATKKEARPGETS